MSLLSPYSDFTQPFCWSFLVLCLYSALTLTLLSLYVEFTHYSTTTPPFPQQLPLPLLPHYSPFSPCFPLPQAFLRLPSPYSKVPQPLLAGYSPPLNTTNPSLGLVLAYSEGSWPYSALLTHYSRFTPSSPPPCSAFTHCFQGCISAFSPLLRGYSGLTTGFSPGQGSQCYSATTTAPLL